jgi:tRNA U34 5-methylaminomethyl-2-thiouridine-forming methyltransferase MnmC
MSRRLLNPLQRYLDGHDPVHIQWELDRLRARTEAARDDATIVALTRAAAARESQLSTATRSPGSATGPSRASSSCARRSSRSPRWS